MPNKKNIQELSELKQKIEKSKSIVIADYSGINVSDQTKLREKISTAGGQFNVTKNRLFKLAIADQIDGDQTKLDEALNGPNAFLFGYDDAVSALKALFEFSQNNEALEIKLGILDGKVLSYQEVENLSKLPSKQELIGQLIARINGPAYGLVNVLNGPTRGLVNVLNAIKESKSN